MCGQRPLSLSLRCSVQYSARHSIERTQFCCSSERIPFKSSARAETARVAFALEAVHGMLRRSVVRHFGAPVCPWGYRRHVRLRSRKTRARRTRSGLRALCRTTEALTGDFVVYLKGYRVDRLQPHTRIFFSCHPVHVTSLPSALSSRSTARTDRVHCTGKCCTTVDHRIPLTCTRNGDVFSTGPRDSA